MAKQPIARIFVAALLILLIGAAATGPARAAAPPTAQYFAATGHTVQGAFLDAFYRFGGVDIIGLPLTDEMIESGYRVQYFERERFEYHPEFANTPYVVELGRLGVEL